MSRLSVLLVLVAGLLIGGLAVLTLRPAVSEAEVRAIAESVVAATPAPAVPQTLDKSAVETIVADFLASQPRQDLPPAAVAELDAGKLNPMIESYLLENPSILRRVSEALQAEVAAEQKVRSATLIDQYKTVIYDDPGHIVLGNPNGDVTLVEMFDYNCGYCKQALPDLATLLDEDPNLRVILKEFPILSPESTDAARVAVLVGAADVDYWAFHEKLFTATGRITKDVALAAASELGLNRMTLEMDMNSPRVNEVLARSFQLADALQITGTPTYIIGDEIVAGAVGIDQLRTRITNLRTCGSTTCPATPG